MATRLIVLIACLLTQMAPALDPAYPPAPKEWIDWPTAWLPNAPGVLAADFLLDKPAGKLGHVVTRDAHFYTGDKRLRLWGVNFAFSACFPTHDRADAVALRLARHGINAVRLHHMDAQPFPAGIFTDKTGETLSAEALDRLDYLVAALKREGVYVDLNLHVSRTWSKAHQWPNADKFPENDDKIIDIFHPDLIKANQQYARDLLTHVNAYTKSRYADEPAVAIVEINNEDTLFMWGGEAAIARLPEPYAGMLKQRWNDWLAKKYATRDDLKKAWAAGEVSLPPHIRLGLREDEDPAKANIASHAPGPSDTQARTIDWFDFLQQTDEAYFVAQRDFLKSELGVKCPITGTIGLGPLGTLSQSKMDFVDAHAYWDHPSFPHRPWDPKDWLIKNEPMVDHPDRSPLWALAATRVAGKPFTVTEYNHAAPNEWQAECIPALAAYAALQDWDGVFLFAYSHNDQYDKGKTASFFDIEGNPLKMPFMPLAARIFLGGQVQPFPPLTLRPTRESILETASQYYYQLWPFVRDSLTLRWQEAGMKRLYLSFDPNFPATPADAHSRTDHPLQWQGDTPGTSIMTINDSHFAAVIGFFAAPIPVDLGPCQLSAMDTPFASFLLVPADPTKTLATADRLLLAAVARAQNTGAQWDKDRRTLSNQWGNSPTQIEPVRGMLTLPKTSNWKVTPLNPDGSASTPIPTSAGERGHTLNLSKGNTLWYQLERVP